MSKPSYKARAKAKAIDAEHYRSRLATEARCVAGGKAAMSAARRAARLIISRFDGNFFKVMKHMSSPNVVAQFITLPYISLDRAKTSYRTMPVVEWSGNDTRRIMGSRTGPPGETKSWSNPSFAGISTWMKELPDVAIKHSDVRSILGGLYRAAYLCSLPDSKCAEDADLFVTDPRHASTYVARSIKTTHDVAKFIQKNSQQQPRQSPWSVFDALVEYAQSCNKRPKDVRDRFGGPESREVVISLADFAHVCTNGLDDVLDKSATSLADVWLARVYTPAQLCAAASHLEPWPAARPETPKKR